MEYSNGVMPLTLQSPGASEAPTQLLTVLPPIFNNFNYSEETNVRQKYSFLLVAIELLKLL